MNATPWAIVLAGGDGTRLKSLSRLLSGDDRPKQFCSLLGGNTLLSRTRARLAPTLPPEHTLFVVVRAHEPFYRAELADLDQAQIVVQPTNRGTTAAIIYGLVRLTRLEQGDPIVALFPTDHDYVDEGRFAQAVRSAMDIVREHHGRLVLLGAEADNAEVEYGWIEPGSALIGECSGESLFRVSRFWERPSAGIARGLPGKRCLWNTFVVVGRARTFLDVLASTVPATCRAFDPLTGDRNDRAEFECARRIYETLQAGDFSHQVLSVCTERLAVLRLGKVGWSDLGTPERVRVAAELRARTWLSSVGADNGARPDREAGGTLRNKVGATPAFEAWLDAYRRRLPKIF